MQSHSRRTGRTVVVGRTVDAEGNPLSIYYAHTDRDPRLTPDHTHIWCWHKVYILGDPKPDNATVAQIPRNALTLPVYLLDHGGLSLRLGPSGDPFDEPTFDWPLHFAGVAWMSKKDIRQACRGNRQLATVHLTKAVQQYSDYLQGLQFAYKVREDI